MPKAQRPHLVLLSTKYKKSFIDSLKELQREGWRKDLSVTDLQKDFASFVRKMRDEHRGKPLSKGRVPQSTYLLVRGENVIGEVRVRHYLNKYLSISGGHIGYEVRPSERKKGYGTLQLKLALSKAKNFGIKKVLITCNDSNIGSAKIIEANGGILKKKIKHEGVLKRQYWIKL